MIRRLALLAPLLVLAVASAAHAAFPGRNGKLVYSTQAESSPRQLAILDPLNPISTPFIPDTNFDDEFASWSPDGKRVVTLRNGMAGFDIWVANADGSSLRQVTTGGSNVDPAWSPDGHHIVYVGPDALYTLNLDDPADSPHAIPGTASSFRNPAWSPDGALIASEHYNSTDNVDQIIVMAPDGSGAHPIVSAPTSSVYDEFPAWAPDGSRLYFAQGANVVGCFSSPKFQIYSVARAGGGPALFSHDPTVAEYHPAPSPDGTQIAFTRCDDPTDDLDHIYVANIDGTGAHAVTTGGNYDNQPNWQPTAPQIGSPPTISGSDVNNQTLTGSAGASAAATDVALQLERCDAHGAACVPIPGVSLSSVHMVASSLTYTLTSADIGHAIRMRQVATNQAGSTALDSAPTGRVAPSMAHCSNRFAGTAKSDRIKGSSGSDRIVGGRGRDKLSGLGGADCISGGAGNDTISGGKGNDTVSGGAGNDRITAGPGRNKVSGGAGNDTINVRNHKRDIVNCGAGKKDRVVADKIDKLRGCERIRRLR